MPSISIADLPEKVNILTEDSIHVNDSVSGLDYRLSAKSLKDASKISFGPVAGLVSTTLQGAIDEVTSVASVAGSGYHKVAPVKVSLTIGPTQSVQSLQAAITYLANRVSAKDTLSQRPDTYFGILLEDGFVWDESIVLDGTDLSHVFIKSLGTCNVPETLAGTLMHIKNGAKSPYLDVYLKYLGTSTAPTAFIVEGGSEINVKYLGINNCEDYCLDVSKNSTIVLDKKIEIEGISSSIGLGQPELNFTNCAKSLKVSLSEIRGGTIIISDCEEGVDFSGSKIELTSLSIYDGAGVRAKSGGALTVSGGEVDITTCGLYGYPLHGLKIYNYSKFKTGSLNLSTTGYGILVTGNSSADLRAFKIDSSTSSPVIQVTKASNLVFGNSLPVPYFDPTTGVFGTTGPQAIMSNSSPGASLVADYGSSITIFSAISSDLQPMLFEIDNGSYLDASGTGNITFNQATNVRTLLGFIKPLF